MTEHNYVALGPIPRGIVFLLREKIIRDVGRGKDVRGWWYRKRMAIRASKLWAKTFNTLSWWNVLKTGKMFYQRALGEAVKELADE